MLDSIGFLPPEVDPDEIGELRRARVFAGYAGWGAGQVENEFQFNGWLHCQADPAIVFGTDPQAKWSTALARLGIGPSGLVADAGRA